MSSDAQAHPAAGMSTASPPFRAGRARLGVVSAYAAQGLGYATVVTALPALKERQGLDDTQVSLLILLVCLAAAGGSVLAEQLSTRRGSRAAVAVGLAAQAGALVVVAATAAPVALIGGFVVYGVGLGMVDAAAAIQGVLLQRRLGRAVMSSFFAAYTAAAIVAALAMSALSGWSVAAGWALAGAAVVLVTASAGGYRSLVPSSPAVPARPEVTTGEPASATDGPTAGTRAAGGIPPLPRRGIVIFGAVVLAAFVADSAVSTWSSIYLDDVLHAAPAVVPLGYAAYQAAILATRLLGDRWVRRSGRVRVAAITTLVGSAGFLPVAFVPVPVAAVIGFALVGVGVGALVPLAFSAAGELVPNRVDEVVARVNVFNYAGAVLGAVAVGLLSAGPGLALAFLLPCALLVPILVHVRRFAPRT